MMGDGSDGNKIERLNSKECKLFGVWNNKRLCTHTVGMHLNRKRVPNGKSKRHAAY